jgi:hypothetical protein
MRTTKLRLLFLLCALSVWTAAGQQKLAQTGMKFLEVGTDARAEGLGEAMTSVEGNASAMFFNPATMARMQGLTSVSLGNTKFIADINHYEGGIAFSPAGGDYGVIGVFVHFVDYGTFDGTIVATNDQGFLDTGPFHPSGMAVGLSYARALNDKFSVGGSAKWVRQSLGISVNGYDASGSEIKANNSLGALAFDFGLLYRTGFKSLNFGMVVRNFSREVEYQKESFQLPLTFRIGASMNILDLTRIQKSDHALLLTFDAEHPRDFAETVRFGAEYVFQDFLSLRVGYVSPQDEYKFTYGIGVHTSGTGQSMGVGIDYAFTHWTTFGDVHRFSLQFSL